MATLASIGGNFTTAASWGVVHSGSYLNSLAANTALTTSYVASDSFSLGTTTIDGIGLKVIARAASPTGTMSVQLWNSTDSVQEAVVTVNVSDLPAYLSANGEGGWVFFKFGSSFTGTGGKNYQVRALTSSASQVTLYRNATAGNWSRYLRGTTTAAPGANDDLIVSGELTSAGAGADVTITNQNTATTTFASLEIGHRGIFSWANAGSTNYYLKITNFVKVGAGGTWKRGTASSPCDASSTFILEFAATSAAFSSFEALYLSTVEEVGATKTVSTVLNADASIGATALTTLATTSGWLNSDDIGIGPTGASTQSEKRVLNGAPSGTTVNITAGLTYAHLGTGVLQAEVINLTRNVKTIGASTSNTYYTLIRTANYSSKYVEHKFIGSNTANKFGVEIACPASSSVIIEGCSFHEGHASGNYIRTNATIFATFSGVDILSCVFYGSSGHLNMTAGSSTDTDVVIDGGVSLACSSFTINISDKSCEFKNYAIAGTTGFYGLSISDALLRTKNISNINIRNCSGGATLNIYGTPNTTVFDNIRVYNNGQYGLLIGSAQSIIFKNLDIRGHSVGGFAMNQFGKMSDCVFYNMKTNSSATATQNSGFIATASSTINNVVFNDCDFSGILANGIDFNLANGFFEIGMNNCTFGAPIPVSVSAVQMSPFSRIGISKFGGVSNTHRAYLRAGLITSDSTIKDSSPFSQRITPSSASYKSFSNLIKVPVVSGQTATITVKVRESVIGDGTDYNGSRIRLLMLPNSCGDATLRENFTICATATVASEGAWETLSYTTPTIDDDTVLNFFIDCDGTTGWINWDSVSIS